jgi:hypothetical protein
VRGTPEGRGAFFAILLVGLLTLPPLAAIACAVAFAAARGVRLRFLPHRSRLDGAITLAALAGGAALAMLEPVPALSPAWIGPFGPGSPSAGSVPVTITVRRDAGFPDVPAVHLRGQALHGEENGRTAALWSGVAPARTPAGSALLRRLPGGGTIAWVPPHPLPRVLVPLLAKPGPPGEGPLARRPLEEMARAAGIPILRGAPLPSDPPLWLRIVETDAPLERETAELTARAGAWIDVRIGGDDEISLAGVGVRLAPVETPASLLDVTPTALHLLGLAIPRDCDGRVLLEALHPNGPGARAPRYRTRAARSSRTRR